MKSYSNGELAQMEQAGKNAEHCVFCGAIIPEGIMVCPVCEGKYQRLKRTDEIREAFDRAMKGKKTKSITIEEALDDMNVLLERINSRNRSESNTIWVDDINPLAVDMAVSALESLNQAILDLERYEVKEDE